MLAVDEANTNLSSFSSDSSQSVWKKIWKIQHFIWRAAKDSLPIKQNLKSQHIPMDETCTLCDDHQETLMNYPVAEPLDDQGPPKIFEIFF